MSVTCRHCGETFDGPTAAMALKRLGLHASKEYPHD